MCKCMTWNPFINVVNTILIQNPNVCAQSPGPEDNHFVDHHALYTEDNAMAISNPRSYLQAHF